MTQDGIQYLKQDIQAYYKGVLWVLVYLCGANLLFGSVCPGVLMTGLPCPACGLTKAGIYLITMQFQRAWVMNPVIYVIGLFLLYFVICRYILGSPVTGWKWMLWGILLLLLMVYFYRMLKYFPEEALTGDRSNTPMVYQRKNLLRWCFRRH